MPGSTTIQNITRQYPLVASQASRHFPRAAQADSGMRENMTRIAPVANRKDFM